MRGPDWHATGLFVGRIRNFESPAVTNLKPMNALNALVFAALGAAMKILPKAFPSLFPPTRSDQDSARALWLAFMGAVQITVAVGFIVRAHFIPMGLRLVSMVPAGSGTLALPSPRGVTTR